MTKQCPFYLLHKANQTTPRNALTGQPQTSYAKYLNCNNHSYGLTATEKSLLNGLGLNNFIETMEQLSDLSDYVMENSLGDKICVPLSQSTARVIDMLKLVGINIHFSVKNIES